MKFFIKLFSVLVFIISQSGSLSGQVSEKKFEKFKKKYFIEETYENGYVIRKKGKNGFANKQLEILIKPEHDILFYDSEAHSLLVGDDGKKINDGGGDITLGYINLEIIDLDDNSVESILEDYSIFHTGYYWRRNKINNQYFPVVKNRNTGKLNIINIRGDLTLEKDYDYITGVTQEGKLYGLNCEDGNLTCSYEILDINKKKYYKSEGVFSAERYASKRLEPILNGSSNNFYGITMPSNNKFNIIDFETSKELLSKDYAKIEIIDNYSEEGPLYFTLKSEDNLLTIYDPAMRKYHIENFDGYIKYAGKDVDFHKLECKNKENLRNWFLIETGEFKYPVWVKKIYSLDGHSKNLRRFITINNGAELHGIYDSEKKTYVVEPSPKVIKSKTTYVTSTKKKNYTFYYSENGNEVIIDLNEYKIK